MTLLPQHVAGPQRESVQVDLPYDLSSNPFDLF